MKDIIGDKIKQYEKVITSIKLDSTFPIVIRLDGNNFSTFTRNLTKPYDIRFSELMQEVSKFALQETGFDIAYVQSDEISLVYIPKETNSQIYHDGKLYKILSKLASKVSVRFNIRLSKYLPDKQNDEPIFDCRIFNLPDNNLAFETIKWRFKDARRNSILSLGYWTLGHNKVVNKKGKEILELLLENNVDWHSYPIEYKYGTFFKRIKTKNKLSEEELNNLPEKHHARLNPELEFERTIIQKYNFDNIKEVREFILNN